MTDVAAFVLARLAEDEQSARAAAAYDADTDDGPTLRHAVDYLGPQLADHIARHDPARVLAQVAALRAVVKLHEPGDDGRCTSCIEYCGDNIYPTEYAKTPCAEVKLLTRIWDWHPDYDPAWA